MDHLVFADCCFERFENKMHLFAMWLTYSDKVGSFLDPLIDFKSPIISKFPLIICLTNQYNLRQNTERKRNKSEIKNACASDIALLNTQHHKFVRLFHFKSLYDTVLLSKIRDQVYFNRIKRILNFIFQFLVCIRHHDGDRLVGGRVSSSSEYITSSCVFFFRALWSKKKKQKTPA